jgi:outer membrane immunogenic protein
VNRWGDVGHLSGSGDPGKLTPRTLILSLALSALGLAHANAADIYRPDRSDSSKAAPSVSAANWTGLYAGAHLGGAWNDSTIVDLDETRATFKNNTSGLFGGGTLGYNWQFGQFVLGLEADFGGMKLSQKTAQPNDPRIVSQIDSGAYGDVTGRFGFTFFNRSLIYGKGGFAFFTGNVKIMDVPEGPAETITTQHDLTGWTLGAGIEHMITPAWSVKAEYQFFDFGSGMNQMPSDHDRFRTDLGIHTVKFGINYHFSL